ncbi:MAG: DUF6268 family outer membrane beta-barrel protein [Candidatus Omnitrophota bacterium]
MKSALCAIALFCLFNLNSYAQVVNSPPAGGYRQVLEEVVVKEEEYFPQELDSYVRYMPSRGAKAQSGKVGIIDSASEYNYEIKAWDKLPVEFSTSVRYIGIENSTVVKLPARLTRVDFGVSTALPFFNFNNTYLAIELSPSFLSDNWNLRLSAFSMVQRYFLFYKFDEKLSFVCGLRIEPHFEDPFWPILGFIYKPNDKLTFNIVPERPEISYALDKKLTVFLEGDNSSEEFRVTKDNLKNAALQYNEMHLGAGFRYNFNKHVKGSLSCGSVFNRSIKYRQDSLGKVAMENGLYTEFRLDIVI